MVLFVYVAIVGPVLTKFRIDQMAFGQPEHTCLNIQNVPFCKTMQIRSIQNSVNQVSTVSSTSTEYRIDRNKEKDTGNGAFSIETISS